MAIERKCILCQIIYNSKQEMDEHMRSMLHHRELENLKGRDSGHECNVCRVMVVGLTDYARHISSPVHKQRVEDSDRQNAGDDHEEQYFDKELVDLINKRRESIRKEEEAAAAKLARENEERKKKEDFQRRLMIATQAYQQDRTSRDWQRRAPPTKGFKGPIGPDGWNGNNVPRGQSWDIQADPRNWHHGRQGKSATWHAQEPPNLQKWGTGEWAGRGRHSRGGWGNKQWSRDSYPGDNRGGRLPWFGHGPNDAGVPLSSSFYYSDVPLPQAGNSQEDWNSGSQNGSQNGEGAYLDNNATGPKGFGSNPKIDKACRWAPYPPTKIFSPPPQEGAQPSPLERPPNNSDQRPKQDSNLLRKPSKWDQKEKVARASAEDKDQKIKPDGDAGERRGVANGVANGVKSRSSSGQRDSPNTASPASAKQKAEKPSKPPGRQLPSTPSPKAPLSRSSSQDSVEQQKPSKSCPKVHQPSKSTSQSPQFSKPSPPVPQHFKSTSQTTKFSKPSPKPPQPSFHLSKSTPQIPQSCILLSKSSSKIPPFPKFTSQSPQLSNTCPQVSQPSTKGSQTLKTSSYSLVGPSLMSSPQGDTQPQSLKEQQLSEMLRRAKETLLVKKSSIDSIPARRADTVLHIQEQGEQSERPQMSAVPQSNKDSGPVQNPTAPVPVRHRAGGEERTEFGKTSSRRGSGLWLQSVQVSTSTKESTPPTAREGEGQRKEEEKQHGGSEKAAEPVMHGVEARQGSESETLASSSSSSTGLAAIPALSSKLGLPPPLKRDLSKHIKAKAGGHEPNLNIARRIRNVSGTWRAETEKESGLKPTVRQLISSSGSRRNVNWDQVYQEVCRKRQGQGKGMPRFGIEMVSYEQEDKEEEEEEDGGDLALLEGIEWEALFNSAATATSPITPRKRSLSESSIAPSAASSSSSLLTAQVPVETAHDEDVPSVTARRGSEQKSTASAEEAPANRVAVKQQEEEEEEEEEGELQLQRCCQVKSWRKPTGNSKKGPSVDSAVGDSSSEMDLTDTQGTGKKRRAAGDIPTPEIPSLETKTKRRKLKSKKERLQVDQLLTVSLKEEELSHSLQAVDHSLIQARAALQAAYMEVQRLLVVKQQVSTEMSLLRTKRIELLQGIQGELDGTVKPRVKELDVETLATVPCGLSHPTPSLLSPTTDAAIPSPCHSAWEPPRRWADPSPPASVSIKAEPLSPDRREAAAPAPSTVHRPDHGSPERPVVTVTDARSDLVQNVPGVTVSTERPALAPRKDSLLGSVTTERPALAPRKDSLLGSDTKKSPGTVSQSSSRRASETGCPEPSASPSSEPAFVFHMPAPPPPCPPEPASGKRVRKLKKRRVLRKAQGSSTEKMDTSDTELEGEEEAARPPRKLRARRRRSGGIWISTSSSSLSNLLATAEQNQGGREPEEGEGAGLGLCLSPGTKAEQRGESSDSSLEMVELPQPAPSEVVTIDTSGPEEEEEEEEEDGLMEVCLYNQGSQTEGGLSLKAEPENLASNEVSSTSEMEGGTAVKTCKSDTQMALPASIRLKTSSDVSSDVGEEDIPAEGSFEGHQEAVNGMQIHGGLLYTCSGDRTVRAFHLVSRKCVAVFEGHSSKVNCLLVSSGPCLQHRLYSGSSDQTLRCYSLKTQQCLEQFSLPDRVLCLHSRWKVLYVGLANGAVITFNVKTNKQLDVFECHGPRAVSCLATAQEGARRILLVGSYDSTISVRDAKSGLLLRTLEGHTKTILCMKVVNDLVFSGSSDQSVHAHNIHTGELVRIYKNHSHAVTVVAILGKVMVTACLDKLVRVYELQSHERLQVYGGHSDMVMCMTIHNSMIYTGCYDGSVQAIKLNLMQNHRCMWQGCSLIFGVLEHLQHHLLNDHGSFNFHTLKCRWKNCDEFFSVRNGTKQGLAKHLQRHVEEEMKLES